ncbi:phage portal protein [Rhodococcus sp. IEGM 1381]|uniref:phage portal protein n=1 Tax=Rhodococcus sp. IEGM 1381 TaxID=3047085 RepID=UPI0024B6A7E1|nr:phage portal protein [Rhodococcus sp. IEGM 1381]MDI9895089.1 phage portal protein [Rhodococcus sp. IEGM 1381]
MGYLAKLFGFETLTPLEIREGSEGSAGGDSPLTGIIPPARSNTLLHKPSELVRIDIVFRSMQYLSTLVSELDLETFVDNEKQDNLPLINKPDPFQSRKAFIQETVSSMVLHGEAFWRVTRNARNEATALEIIDPEAVTVEKRNGVIVYFIGQSQIRRDSIRHLKLNRVPGQLRGMGAIQAAPGVFRFALMLQDYIEQFFNIGITPRGLLTTKDHINIDDMQDAADGFIKFLKDHQQLAVLPSGLDYKSINLDPNATNFIEVLHEVNLQLCRLLGVPAEAMEAQTQSSTTYQNLQQANTRFLQGTLNRFLDEIEDHFSDLLPGRRTVKFKEEDLLRLDPKAQREAEKIDIENGTVTANEIRATRGLPPLAVAPVEQDDKNKEQPNENGD